MYNLTPCLSLHHTLSFHHILSRQVCEFVVREAWGFVAAASDDDDAESRGPPAPLPFLFLVPAYPRLALFTSFSLHCPLTASFCRRCARKYQVTTTMHVVSRGYHTLDARQARALSRKIARLNRHLPTCYYLDGLERGPEGEGFSLRHMKGGSMKSTCKKTNSNDTKCPSGYGVICCRTRP